MAIKQVDFRYAKIESHVLELIENGTLSPGDRLPSLRRMAKNMRVSVPTVAQAYQELESQGVVQSRERSGFFVDPDYGTMPAPKLDADACCRPVDCSKTGLFQEAMDALRDWKDAPFGFGCPDYSLLAGHCLGKVLRKVVLDDPIGSITQDWHHGDMELRKQISILNMDAGAVISPEDILVTSGTVDGITLTLRALTRPGDAILIQSPVFLVYLRMVEYLGLRAIEIPSCPCSGISVEQVRRAVDNFNIRACVFIPNFHMDGSLTSDEAKKELVELLADRDIPLIEDDVYGELYYDEKRPSLCKSFDKTGNVITASSFSKTIAPGYRVGWIIPGKFKKQVARLKDLAGTSASTPMQLALAEFLRQGQYSRHINKLRSAMSFYISKKHCRLGNVFPEGTSATKPKGGTCLWVKLPDGVDSNKLFYRARKKGVYVVPGSILSFSDTFRSYIRINCRGIYNDEVRQAINTLGTLAHELC